MRGIFLLLAVAAIQAARAGSALEAVKQLPAGEAARLAHIEGRDGTPSPDRWYVIVHDPAAENGVREYAIEDGRIAATRSLSQFADRVTDGDILAAGSLKIDSDAALKIAQGYAEANQMKFEKVDYSLEQNSDATVWRLKCFDRGQAAELTVSAETGAVLAHPGFALDPAAASERKTKATAAASTPRRAPIAQEPQVMRAIPVAEEPVAEETPRRKSATQRFMRIFRGRERTNN